MFNARYFTCFFLACCLFGCASTGNKRLIKTETSQLNIAHITIKKKSDPINVDLSTLGYDGTSLAQSMYQAQFNASLNTPGYNAAAGFAGALIGGAIGQSMAVSRAQKKKNTPVNPWLNTLTHLPWESLSSETKNQFFTQINAADKASNTEPNNTLNLEYSLAMTANYMSLELRAHAEVLSSDKTPVYRNYFHIQSKDIMDLNKGLDQLNQYNQENAEEYVTGLLKKLPYLVLADLYSDDNPGSPQSIRFKNHMGDYYELGYVIRVEEDYITFKSLRGEVKHYPYIEEVE